MVSLPVFCVDWRLERIKTKTKIPLTSKARKSKDLNTIIQSCYTIFLTYYWPFSQLVLWTWSYRLCKPAGNWFCIIALLPTHVLFNELHCSNSCHLLFFLNIIFSGINTINRHPSDGDNCSWANHARPNSWACSKRLKVHVSLNACCFVTLNKENSLRLVHLNTCNVLLPWQLFHSAFARFVGTNKFSPRTPRQTNQIMMYVADILLTKWNIFL